MRDPHGAPLDDSPDRSGFGGATNGSAPPARTPVGTGNLPATDSAHPPSDPVPHTRVGHDEITWVRPPAARRTDRGRDREHEIDKARSRGSCVMTDRATVARDGARPGPCVLVALTVLAGCGAPEYTYVTNSEDRTYLRIPHSWRPIDERALDEAIGLDPTDETQQQRVLAAGLRRRHQPRPPTTCWASTPPAPAVFIGVRDVPELARGQISLDLLRDLFRPVSASAREEAAMNPASPFTGFSLMTRRGADARVTGCAGCTWCTATGSAAGRRRCSTRSPTSTTTPASFTCSTCAARQTATSSASRRSPTWSHRSPFGRPHDDPLRPPSR